MVNSKMTMGSLFSGSGAFELAAEMVGMIPLWSSEVALFPRLVTKTRMPYVQQLGNVSTIDGAKVSPVDVLVGGFPCQSVSTAGKREGLSHVEHGGEKTTRSGLFYEAARITEEMRRATNGRYPRFFVAENVPGLLSSRGGKTSGAFSSPYARSLTQKFLFLCLEGGNGCQPERFWEKRSPSHGECLTRNISASPKEENVSTLSQILEAGVPERYYLSEKACRGILRRASERGKELPDVLKTALERQAGIA